MANSIDNHPSPGEPGTKVDGMIQTPMCDKNVGRQNTPGTEKYKGTMTMGSGKPKTDNSIMGPGAGKNNGKY